MSSLQFVQSSETTVSLHGFAVLLRRVFAIQEGKETSVEIRMHFENVGNRHVLNVPAENIRTMPMWAARENVPPLESRLKEFRQWQYALN
jgi:hypothetical protein